MFTRYTHYIISVLTYYSWIVLIIEYWDDLYTTIKNDLIIFESVKLIRSIEITMITFCKTISLNKCLYFLTMRPDGLFGDDTKFSVCNRYIFPSVK